jgi:hypothetical protein
MRMKIYRFTKKGREYPTFIVDTQDIFQIKLEEFKQAYGLNGLDPNDKNKYIDGLIDSRMSLYKDKARLNLSCNPMTDDIAVIFSEWIATQPGFKTLSVEGFEFPY